MIRSASKSMYLNVIAILLFPTLVSLFVVSVVSCKRLRQESFIEEIELLREDELANDLVVEGEFVTELTMRQQWKWPEFLDPTIDS